ncbi:MAG: TIR domain-containing protein [Bacteroidia bacterium]
MARKVYFSFHYDRDIVRVARIRNCAAFLDESQPFMDKAEWEEVKKKGDSAIMKWIDTQMVGTSVLIVCIGTETYKRKWVRYEIRKAYLEGKGIVGIYVHRMKHFNGKTDEDGTNPLSTFSFIVNGQDRRLSDIFSTYCWEEDDGYDNIEKWIEEAAGKVGR